MVSLTSIAIWILLLCVMCWLVLFVGLWVPDAKSAGLTSANEQLQKELEERGELPPAPDEEIYEDATDMMGLDWELGWIDQRKYVQYILVFYAALLCAACVDWCVAANALWVQISNIKFYSLNAATCG